MSLSNHEILRIVKALRAETSWDAATRWEHCQKTYPTFAAEYGILAEKSCQEDFEMERLEFMLRMRQKVQEEEYTQHDASVIVGEELATTYVKPLVE